MGLGGPNWKIVGDLGEAETLLWVEGERGDLGDFGAENNQNFCKIEL